MRLAYNRLGNWPDVDTVGTAVDFERSTKPRESAAIDYVIREHYSHSIPLDPSTPRGRQDNAGRRCIAFTTLDYSLKYVDAQSNRDGTVQSMPPIGRDCLPQTNLLTTSQGPRPGLDGDGSIVKVGSIRLLLVVLSVDDLGQHTVPQDSRMLRLTQLSKFTDSSTGAVII